MKNLFTLLSLQFIIAGAFAQTKDITGTITNDKNEPITGASVRVKNNAQSSSTDDNGVFVLKGISDTSVLVIAATGYQETEISTIDQTTISVTMTRANLLATSIFYERPKMFELVNNDQWYKQKVNKYFFRN